MTYSGLLSFVDATPAGAVSDTHRLRGLRCILINPHKHPVDLRGEIHSESDEYKSESGMNFGLLVVASVLAKAGALVRVLDFEAAPANWRSTLRQALDDVSPNLVGVGSLSVYSFLPTLDCLRFCKELSPDVTTVVGGQNAQNFPQLLKGGWPDVIDYLVCGDGEHAVEQIGMSIIRGTIPAAPGITRLSREDWNGTFTAKLPLTAYNSLLEYSLYPGYRHLWPVIEESRGCPFKCDFCANPLQGGAKIRFKPPELLMQETRHLFATYQNPVELPTVLMTSIFGVNPQLTREYFSLLRQEDLRPRFVASTRVDLHVDSYIEVAAPYLDQMHFGLESGSVNVIRRMVKAVSPEAYLSSARRTLAAYRDQGVHTAVNFIVGYLGETHETVQESIGYLKSSTGLIESVWGGGLIAYPDSPFSRAMDSYRQQFGASLESVSEFCDTLQTYPVNPSSTLNYRDVLEYCDEVHDLFFDRDKFYHHYKWYIGPDKHRDQVSFVSKEEFFTAFDTSIGNPMDSDPETTVAS